MVSVLDDIFGTPTDKNRETIQLKDIKRDGGTQMRAGLDPATVTEYTDAMVSFGAQTFPPLVVFYDGMNYWLADGFHRYAALEQVVGANGPVACDVRAGTQRDAMLHAASANASHGLRRTNADKRRAVMALLQDPEWSQWSDGEIAKRCAVSQPFVSGLRPKPVEATHNGYESTAPAPATRKGSDGREYKVKPAMVNYAEIWQLETSVSQVKATTEEMRFAARENSGYVWECYEGLAKTDYGAYRKRDLVQAINNVAAQMEANEKGTNSPNLGTAGMVPVVTPAAKPPPFPDKPMAEWTEEEWSAAEEDARAQDDERAALNAARRDAAIDILETYRQVLRTESKYSELTGDFMGTVPVIEGLRKMIKGLESLIEALQ